MFHSVDLKYLFAFDLLRFPILRIRLAGVKLIYTGLLGLCCLISGLASADVGISTKRIYLDQDNSIDNFVISNRGFTQQSCKLATTHFIFDEFGHMSEYTGKSLPDYAAENVMRFSPKSFLIDANKKQTVRFTLRRKKDIAAMEHRAYLVVDCVEKADNNSLKPDNKEGYAQISIKPRLLHNIPIIIRPTKLSATVEFSNVTLNKDILAFDISRSGNRSVFGIITVSDRSSGDKVSHSNPVVIYVETLKKSFNMAIPEGNSLDELVITLDESPEYGGNISHSWPIINKP